MGKKKVMIIVMMTFSKCSLEAGQCGGDGGKRGRKESTGDITSSHLSHDHLKKQQICRSEDSGENQPGPAGSLHRTVSNLKGQIINLIKV